MSLSLPMLSGYAVLQVLCDTFHYTPLRYYISIIIKRVTVLLEY